MPELLEPKIVTLKTQGGAEKTYILSKFPAIQGREIVAKYPLSAIISALPKMGDYKASEDTMLLLMAFVAVDVGGTIQPLTTRALIENHVPDWETLARLEIGMLEYNVSFFSKGASWFSSESIVKKVAPLITKILTDLSAQLSRPDAPRSMN